MTSPDMQAIREQVSNALIEDLGGELNAANDITANLIDESVNAKATIITREPCVVCGIAWANQAFALIDESVSLTWHVKDGDKVDANTVLVSLEGSARAILTAERTALNFLQTLSATATVT
ncbi:MAG: nicotinate-nucleotide diphosphorylase (carboxylating), partial [Alteromonas macleodii]|nr:nicotinate-nucleotide diphosphorylase (carboxylating) [Alteromonas macleodii]